MIDQADRLRDIIKAKTELENREIKTNLNARLITITSGKGGVGKTNFAVNLAIQLSKKNKRVVIIDVDFGLANIEVLFGVIPKFTFADLLSGNKPISEILTEGPHNIKFISGGSGLSEMSNLTHKQMMYIIENFSYLDSISDIIIIDTGAGISKNVINFIRASTETIILTTPEPTSVTDAYAIIKGVKEERIILPEFKLVVNRVDDSNEGLEIYNKLSKVADRFLGVGLQNLGCIPTDNQLVKAVKRQVPVSICFPNSEASKAIEEISRKLLNIDSTVKPSTHSGMLGFIKRLVNIFGENK